MSYPFLILMNPFFPTSPFLTVCACVCAAEFNQVASMRIGLQLYWSTSSLPMATIPFLPSPAATNCMELFREKRGLMTFLPICVGMLMDLVLCR